mgnify:CR=1 FL=1
MRTLSRHLVLILVLTGLVADAPAQDRARAGYKQFNLVSDIAGVAPKRDRRLVNPWGISASPTGPWWISDNESSVTTAYNRVGVPVRNQNSKFDVAIPSPANQRGEGKPTGIVYNPTDDFVLIGDFSAPARFIIVTEEGLITGWNSNLSDGVALTMVDNSGAGAKYTGVALLTGQAGSVLAVANFAQGVVELYDRDLQLTRVFMDDTVGEDYAPFNVQNVDGFLYVAFALRSDDGDEVAGPGLGFVDVYTPDGEFQYRFVTHGVLNAPWAIVHAPSNFGDFSGAILVGNFGDGRISAFDEGTGELLGQLSNKRGEPLEIEGLWGLAFGNGAEAGRTNWLYFAAGIDDEAHGLFGRITAQSQASTLIAEPR